ncbi:UNVERIFIED_CONTAM: hypothetical protein GTU68_054684 [Idotea baltica]|nr:hypothetical protein [Idotea baltica]
MEFVPSIVLSAAIAIAYTALGGLWAVALTDVLQLTLLLLGLGFEETWALYEAKKGALATLFPPWDGWRSPDWGDSYWNWWDSALLLIFGGIPWQVYFQRVLSAKTEGTAVRLSIIAGFVCILAAIPAILIGMIGDVVIATVGLGAIAAAVMSSVDSSILSASSMAAWNIYRPLIRPDLSSEKLSKVIKKSIWIIGISATLISLKVKSVYVLWFLCSDFVYTLIFPALACALFDKKANVYGAAAGFAVAFILRWGGGIPEFGLMPWIPYPMIDEAGIVLFPFRTVAMLSGLITLLGVSRITQRFAPAKSLFIMNT